MAADENRTPRHGRHAAGRHAAPRAHEDVPTPVESPSPQVAPAPVETVAPRAASTPVSVPDVVPVVDGDQETSMEAAPRPIGVDPAETGSFQRISSDAGARVTTRANASETASFHLENARPMEAVRMSSSGRPKVAHREVEVQSNRRVFIILGVAAALVVALVGSLLTRALSSVDTSGEQTVAEQVQKAVDEPIEYRGTTYALTENGSTYALTSTSEGSEGTAVLHELKGVPVALILYNTVFVIPENLPDGTWDLIACPLGGVAQQVTDSEQNPVTGKGEITEATLVGDEVRVVTADGTRTTVSLV